jgi:hypothetical protein
MILVYKSKLFVSEEKRSRWQSRRGTTDLPYIHRSARQKKKRNRRRAADPNSQTSRQIANSGPQVEA